MGDCVIAHLNPDPATAHLVRNGCSGAGAKEGIEHKVA